jgi:uncharacterized protein
VLAGADGEAPLRDVLVRRALAWAGGVGEAWLAGAPVPPGVHARATRAAALAAAAAEVLEAEGAGPLLIVRPEFPRLSTFHARAALHDLEGGCDLVLGPALDGGWYLLGLWAAQPDVFAVAGEAEGTEHVMEKVLAAAGGASLEVGLLRPERLVRSEDGRRAALLDPLTPPDVAAALRS